MDRIKLTRQASLKPQSINEQERTVEAEIEALPTKKNESDREHSRIVHSKVYLVVEPDSHTQLKNLVMQSNVLLKVAYFTQIIKFMNPGATFYQFD